MKVSVMGQCSGDNQSVLWIAMVFGQIYRKTRMPGNSFIVARHSWHGILCLQQHPPHITQHLGKVGAEAGCVRAVNDAMVE